VAKHQEGEKYLQPEQYYIDLYDLFTIQECMDLVDFYRKAYKDSYNNQLKDMSEEDRSKDFSLFLHRHLFVVKANRYKNKQERIQEWTERDRKKQNKYDGTPIPVYHCPECKIQMTVFFKTLDHTTDNDKLRMLFFLECPKCKKREGIYDDGEIRVSEPFKCPKCGKRATYTHKEVGKVYKWITKCKHCGYKKEEVDDFEKNQEERDRKAKEDKELLERYKTEFCLSDKEDPEHVETLEALEYSAFAKEDEKRKYDNPAYEQVSKIRKINITELETTLEEELRKEDYIKLTFLTPETGQFFIVPFSVQDANAERSRRNSTQDLEKLIKTKLEGTNWKLTTDITNRLGYISGKLKGFEREEDLIDLAGKIKPEPNPITDLQKRQKLELNSFVQIARMAGKHEAIENIRNRRLKNEPDGFNLNEPDSYYTCPVCKETKQGNKMWWDKWGMKCLDCQRNLNNGVFPPEIIKNDKMWFKDWEIKDYHNIQPATRAKFIREGLLKPRELKLENGSVYYRLYLVEENKVFLEKFPKKPREIPKITFKSKEKDST